MPRIGRTTLLTTLVALLLVSASAFVLYRCRFKPVRLVQAELPGHTRVGWLEIVQEDVPPQNILQVKPAELPAYIDAIYRLKPDRRVLYAVGEIHRLLSGKQEGPVSIRFRNRGWIIRLGAQEVGSLPEIPSLSDSKALLSSWVDREWKQNAESTPNPLDPAVVTPLRWYLEKGPAPTVITALARLNEAWKGSPRNPELTRLACRGYVWLLLQTFDRLQLSDAAAGKALALLVLAEHAESSTFAREEALLAWELGYETAAQVSAGALRPDDPVRLFVEFDDIRLRAMAEMSRQPEAQYLYLLRLAAKRDFSAWSEWLSKSTWSKDRGTPVLSAALTVDEFGTTPRVATALESQVLQEVLSSSFPERGPEEPSILERFPWLRFIPWVPKAPKQVGALPPEARLRQFERVLARRASTLDGPILDRESIEGLYRAQLYSGVYENARFLNHKLCSTPDAERYGNSLIDVPPGTAANLKKWIFDEAGLFRGQKEALSVIASDLSAIRRVGIEPLKYLREDLLRYSRAKYDPFRYLPIRGYFDALDTRPGSLVEAGDTAYRNLHDLRRTERFLVPGVREAPVAADTHLPQCARFSGDTAWLRRIVGQEGVSTAVRAQALRDLKELGYSDASFMRERYIGLIRQDPQEMQALDDYLGLLEKEGDLKTAAEVIGRWNEARGGKQDLNWAHIETTYSVMLRKAGRLEEAWRVIEPTMDTWKSECLQEASYVLAAMGKLDEGLEVANRELERYPEGGWSAADVVEMLWRRGDYVEAARVLDSSRSLIHGYVWESHIGRAFARVFAKRDPAGAESAFAPLVSRQFNPISLANLPEALAAEGNEKLAFKLLLQIKAEAEAGMTIRIMAYELLKKEEGREAAAAWLRSAMSPTDRYAGIVDQRKQYDLLWDLFDEHSRNIIPNVLYLRRAAALLYTRSKDEARRAEIAAYLERARAKDPVVIWGKYLLGLAHEEAVLPLGRNLEYLCSTAWILGLKAASENRYEEAADWLQVSVEAGAAIPTGGEPGGAMHPAYGSSSETLWSWTDAKRFLSGVAAEGIF